MHELQELQIENAYAIPEYATSAVSCCVGLVKIAVRCDRWKAWGASAARFVSALPPGVTSLSVAAKSPRLLSDNVLLPSDCFAGSPRKLDCLHVDRGELADFMVLHPIASTLCHLSISSSRIVCTEGALPPLGALEHLCLRGVTGVNGPALARMLASLSRLETLEIGARATRENLSDFSIAAGLRGAACA